jgi:mRNA-degrading endonuclease toxin of MazEF toxin-antitoxin module
MRIALQRGEIVKFSFGSGRNKKAPRLGVVLSPMALNAFKAVLVCPIAQSGMSARAHGFSVPLRCNEANLEGYVLCHRIATIGLDGAVISRIGTLPRDVLEDVLARVRSIFECDHRQ